MEPTNICIECNQEFTANNPCCCDVATHDSTDLCKPPHPPGIVLHEEGVCVRCHKGKHTARIWDGKAIAGGTFERGE